MNKYKNDWKYEYIIEEPEALGYMYWHLGASGIEIGEIVGCTPETVYGRMKKYGIPRRTNEESMAMSRDPVPVTP